MTTPKYDKHLKEAFTQLDMEKSQSRYGIIMDYNARTNTATVLMSSPDSDQMGDLLRDVTCPVYMGVQMASPERGRPCWVSFRDRVGEKYPIITSYFNHKFDQFDYERHYTAVNGVPSFLFNM